MKKISFITILVLAVVFFASCRCGKKVPPAVNGNECAVLGFQYGNNVTAEEAKDITDIFRINFRPSKYKETDFGRVDKEVKSRGYKNNVMTKQQICEVGRSLGAKFVVYGTINKLMDEFSVDVQVVNVSKETTVAFEGNAFLKSDSRKEIQNIARRLATKLE